MALKVFYSPIIKNIINRTTWEACYMNTKYFLGAHVAGRINNKGYLVILDEKDVPEGVDKDVQLKDLGLLETTSALISNDVKNSLGNMNISSDKIAICSSRNQLFKKLLYHRECGINVAMIKSKIAAGKRCFMGFKTEEMDF